MTYQASKIYGHNLGLSCCFRQWRADSHCKYLHGYALQIEIDFEAKELDQNNWVIDFGRMKELRALIENEFDHKTLVAADDPHLAFYREGRRLGIMDVLVVGATGCESFARGVYGLALFWLKQNNYFPRVQIAKVTVREHGANSASYIPDTDVA